MAGIARVTWLALLVAPCYAASAATPLAVFRINEEAIRQLRDKHPLALVEVLDPVYKRKQRYEGFWLRDVLKDLSPISQPESGAYLRFRCKDGYLPIMPLARALAGQALLAIRDANAPPGDNWQPLPGSATPSNFGPGYLVWVSPPGDTDEYPWPFQIVAIELVSSADALSGLALDGEKQGYELFVKHCVKCHAINGVGGTFGPELNSPCSVTEYWNPWLLSRFIANAESVRAGTRMPNFQSLPGTDIQAIVAYLRSMSSHKKSGAVCPESAPKKHAGLPGWVPTYTTTKRTSRPA